MDRSNAADWLTARRIADMGLPGLPSTTQRVTIYAQREGWRDRTGPDGRPLARRRGGRGGGWEYHVSLLPGKALAALRRRRARALTESEATPARGEDRGSAVLDTALLTARQRDAMNARLAILGEIDRLAETGIGRYGAIETLVGALASGALCARLRRLVPVANAKSGLKSGKPGRDRLTARSVERWLSLRDKGGPAALAPRSGRVADKPEPDWAWPFMRLWADPRKPSLRAVVARLPECLPAGAAVPSYDQCRRFLKAIETRFGVAARMRGRMGPQALKRLRAFTRRDVSELWPGAVYSADGHTFKAAVEHPFHGQPFRPEITVVVDVFTRYAVGWSVGLAENGLGVLEALSDAMIARRDGRKRAVPAIWYTDNGPGFRAKVFEAAAVGFFERWGITAKRSLSYNSQARGVIERLNRTLWLPAARKLASYDGRDLDKEARRRRAKERRLSARAGRAAPFELTWAQFKDFLQAEIDAYNARPHRGLPRRRDPETLRYAHMTPLEAWERWEADGGLVDVVGGDEAADLIRPYERRRCNRCEVRVNGNIYFSHDLEAHHGKDVMVGYDIHDASRVWVRDCEHRLVAVAALAGNARPYFGADAMAEALSRQERCLRGRTRGRLQRLDEKRAEILAEAKGEALEIAHGPVRPLSDLERAGAERALARIERRENPREEPRTINGRPVFGDDMSYVRWLRDNPEAVNDGDRAFLRSKLDKKLFQQLLDMAGIDPAPLLALARPERHPAI